ncbi:MAG: SLC13 family permease [Oscillospiraceae bacterium]|nr:SLC13 family permease [Oscillospiraceae bacterium]
MRSTLRRIFAYLRGEIVLTAAWALALLSMLAVPPDSAYPSYIDLHTLGLLFALMAVMAGLRQLGLFRTMGEAMLRCTATTRQLEALLIFLPFFTSMAVTNDVALITFVPFALEVLSMAGQEQRVIPVVAAQTIAANLGSMTTPIGNPQNLYLYSHYGLSMGEFFSALLPLTVVSALLLALFILLRKSQPISVTLTHVSAPLPKGPLCLLLGLFLLCLGVVAGLLPLWLVCLTVVAALLIIDRTALLRVDYPLLLTFVGFFVFVGNLGRVPLFRQFFEGLLTGHEVICSVAASQIISNVPAALLLSGFTRQARSLLIGVNLGGLGTLIASMASLISYKYLANAFPEQKGKYLARFTLANVIFLAVLLAVWKLFL